MDVFAPPMAQAPRLHTVNGGVEFAFNLGLKVLHLPELHSKIDGYHPGHFRVHHNYDLVSVHVPKLNRTEGHMSFYENPKLVNISFPALQSVGRPWGGSTASLAIYRNPEVTLIEFGALETCIEVDIRTNAALLSISFPKLAEAYQIYVVANPSLKTLSFPSLAKVTTSVSVSSNAALTSVSFPKVVKAKTIYVHSNPSLTSISFPKVVEISKIQVYNNPLLTKLSLPSLRRVAYGSISDIWSGAVFLLHTNPKLVVLEFGALQEIKDPLQAYNNGPGLDCSKLKEACGRSIHTGTQPGSAYATGFGCKDSAANSRYGRLALNKPGTKDHGKHAWGPNLQTC